MKTQKENAFACFLIFGIALLASGVTAQVSQIKIRNPQSGDITDGLGTSISIDGNTLITGAAIRNGFGECCAMIFVNDGTGKWSVQSTLRIPEDGGFGRQVAVSGDTAVIGGKTGVWVFARSNGIWSMQAKIYSHSVSSAAISGNTILIGGSTAYVFVRSGSNWTQQAQLINTNRYPNSMTGDSRFLAISGDTALVFNYVFVRNGSAWTKQKELAPASYSDADKFYGTVSISGDTALVTPYVYTRNGSTWTMQQRLSPSDGSTTYDYGRSVAVSSDTAIIGCDTSNFAYVFRRSGTTWTQQRKLTSVDGHAGNDPQGSWFGYSVAISGNTAAIGIPEDNTCETGSGSAAIFSLSATDIMWDCRVFSLLEADDYDLFGSSASVSGNTAIIGACQDRDVQGSAYIFENLGSTWTLRTKLVASDGDESDLFGCSASISGDTAIVGAYRRLGATANTWDTGAAYIFSRLNGVWMETAKLTPPTSNCFGRFGWAVSLSGDTAIVGSYLDDQRGFGAGSAYIFTKSGSAWTQEARILPSDIAEEDHFGWTVSISGNTAIIGTWPKADVPKPGFVYIYARTNGIWTEQAKIVSSNFAAADSFGSDVAISGDTAIIGAMYGDDPTTDSGAAYIFKRTGTTWVQQARITALDAYAHACFGGSVSISSDVAVVGAPFSLNGSSPVGSAYIFTRNKDRWSQKAKLSAADSEYLDEFGQWAAVDAGNVVIGVPRGDKQSGAVYISDLRKLIHPTGANLDWALYK